VRGQLLGCNSTSPASSGRCKRSRPRWTAAMNLERWPRGCRGSRRRTPRRPGDLPLPGPGLIDDVLRRTLGLANELMPGALLALAPARLLEDPLGLALGLGPHLLALRDDPARLPDLLGDRRPHLFETVVELLLVHAHLVSQCGGRAARRRVVSVVGRLRRRAVARRRRRQFSGGRGRAASGAAPRASGSATPRRSDPPRRPVVSHRTCAIDPAGSARAPRCRLASPARPWPYAVTDESVSADQRAGFIASTRWVVPFFSA
jgi:hypothetical protein